MDIKSSLQKSQHDLVSNNAALAKAKSTTIEAQSPVEKLNAAPASIEHTLIASDEEIKRFQQEAYEYNVKNFEIQDKTQAAFTTTLKEFEKFKGTQSTLHPNIDLNSLDLAQKEDGTLQLVGGNITDALRADLETQINANDELKSAYKQVHEGMADIVRYFDVNSNAEAKDFYGKFRLNELSNSFEKQFHDDGFGQDYHTLEEKVLSSSLLFSYKMADAINPRINISV
ncbi:hypothetical protein [Pseudoalteromonas luteoviolacea]|uniref:Uncharacterized protein n=1 Tax=Pseudoalteromonas luteoviolacea NCIMB 1942 TaxID=1365253 RepID=A0A167HAR0_9GAMM|nr:hypothetical protein [Pseudoalteromonas luteoviolacea]KZN57913.1 hypothetical protein N482_23255 [Pseudoalteromonas luteoviolacea NCIMB 1942]